jgi:large subunit ribosomal protein L17
MRHNKKTAKLNKSIAHRRSMSANMAISLFSHEQIMTTLPKAKFLRPYIERLITRAKKGGLANRRYLLSVLYNDHFVVNKMLTEIAERYKDRKGGYTRVLKAGFRYGDSAPMAYIELVDRNTEVKGKRFSKEVDSEEKASEE